MPDISEIRTVLILMPDKHMGNLVVSLVAIKKARDFLQGKRTYLVVDESYQDIIRSVFGTENVLFYPRRQLDETSSLKHARIFFDFAWKVRSLSSEMVLDMVGSRASSLLAYLSGAGYRIGMSFAKRSFLLNHKVDESLGKHRLYIYLDLISAVGIPGEAELYAMTPSTKDLESVRSLLRAGGIDTDKPLVCIHPGAGKEYKQWHSRNFALLADWLTVQGCEVLFIGAAGDRKKIDEIRGLSEGRSHDLCQRLTLGELIALFSLGTLMIGNDSGPVHLAAVTGIPVIALFGPTDENRWRPLTDRAVVLRGSEPCDASCNKKRCHYDYRCMTSLSPEAVQREVLLILRDSGSPDMRQTVRLSNQVISE